MDVVERLSLESVSEHTLIACEHLHRYEIAAELASGLRVLDLCCGTGYGTAILAQRAASVHGVDLDVATVDIAAATVGSSTGATFEARDALAFLRGEDIAERFDAIVCFEGLEHLPDVDGALRELRRHAAAGLRIVASVPNSKAFEEENDFHLTNFGWEEARAAWEEFDNAVMLFQHLAEGSVVLAEGAEELDARIVHLDYGEAEFANHFIVAVGFDPDAVRVAHRARTQLVLAPVYNRYMRILERANAELRSRNAQLARGLIGRADSGAASFVSRLEQRVSELEERERELEARLQATAQLESPRRRLRRLARLLRR
ncbi:MAG TPA: class I SAM-dependent methyltransferase [Solirubrobacterales bacterium]|jgi:2-polyprenyl-3-methyl-5-hydroxy-6-metoxy-1,4-benzoquinol methylase|nr:class I SAM-dependent methyltransferase [Solirubrobacterales bacterium]